MANYYSSNYKRNNIFSSNTQSTMYQHREYQPSYPSISRFSSSPCRRNNYLDDSDEEIIRDEIVEITNFDHYPTLDERWGDDTKTIVRQQGDMKIEEYVEFEETEPTTFEEISYEIIYEGDQIKSTREIYRSRSESRNFRKLKKQRIKRKRAKPLLPAYVTLPQYDDSSIQNVTSRNYEILPSIIHGKSDFSFLD
jgi:hypothetical protein